MSMVLNSLEVIAQNDTPAGLDICTIDVNGLAMADGLHLKQGTGIYNELTELPFMALTATTAVSQFIWVIREGLWVFDSVTLYFQTGSTSGSLQVTHDTSTNAPGAGTVQLTGVISLAAAAQQTVLTGTRIASPTTYSPGDRVGLLFAGTVTNLVSLVGSVGMKRIG